MSREPIGKRISDYLREPGTSKRWLADKAGMPYQVLLTRLNGRNHLDVEEYATICEALGVSYGFFFEEAAAPASAAVASSARGEKEVVARLTE